MPIPTPIERVGSVLAQRYQLERLLARGGMGVLYLGRHLLTGRRVAVKVVHSADDPGTALADRFLREARLAAGLEHPNVVQVFDMGVDQDHLFLVMELLEGESLAALLDRERKLSPAAALGWLWPVMGALAVAHDHLVVHRDVKPDNIFLARRGAVVVPTLLDFGVAKQVGGGTLTESGLSVGTPAFMSPEQARGEVRVGPECDVWAMGVLLYRALVGELPFEAASTAGVLVQIVSGPTPSITERAPDVPLAIVRCVERAMERDPAHRYPGMRAMAEDLVHAARSLGIELPDDPDPIGLPSWRQWRQSAGPNPSTASSGGASSVTSVPRTTADAPLPERSGTRRSKPPQRRLRTLLLLGLAALGAGAAWVSWRSSQAPVEVPAAAPPTAVRVEPAAPPSPARVETPPAAPGAEDGDTAAPLAREPSRPVPTPPATASSPSRKPAGRVAAPRRRRGRGRRSSSPSPSRPVAVEPRAAEEPRAPRAAPAAEVEGADDPFQIRRDYRSKPAAP